MSPKITAQNAQYLSQRICLGRGQRLGATWLDNTTLSVCTTLGMWNYHTDGSEEHIGFFEDDHTHPWVSVAYSPDKKLIACVGGTYLEYAYVRDIASWQDKFKVHCTLDPMRGLSDIAFSPDGRFLAGSSHSATYLWDAHSGQIAREWRVNNGGFCKVMFTPDSKTLIVAGDMIRTWDITNGDQIHEFPLIGKSLLDRGTLSHDGTKFAWTSMDTARVWDIQLVDKLFALPLKHPNKVIFHPSGEIIAIRAAKNIRLHDFKRQQETILEDTEERFGGIAFNGDGTLIAVGNFDNTLSLWDVSLGAKITAIENTAYNTIGFNLDGTVLACTERDETLHLLNIANNQQHTFQQGHSSHVYPFIINTQESTITSGSDDHSARLWNINTGQHSKSAHVWGGDFAFFEFSPDGRLLLASDSDKYHHGAMWVQDLETGERLLTKAEGSPVRFNDDGKWILYREVGTDHSQQLFALNIQTQEIRLLFHFSLGEYGRLSPDCRFMELHRRDQSINVVEVETKKICVELGGSVERFEFSSDSNYFMTVNDLEGKQGSYITVVRKTATGEKVLDYRDVYQGHLLSPDAKSLILTHTHNDSPKILDMIRKKARATLPIKGTHTFAFSPDSSLFASGDYLEGSSVKVWQTDTCQCLATLEGHRSSVTNIKFSDDQTLLVSAGRDGTIRVWDLSKVKL